MLCIQSLEVDSQTCIRKTHPEAYERIYSNISFYSVGDEELIVALCSVMLQYLFRSENINVNLDGTSFSSILGELLFDISRLNRN